MRILNWLGFNLFFLALILAMFGLANLKARGCDYAQAAFGCAPAAVVVQDPVYAPAVVQAPVYVQRQAAVQVYAAPARVFVQKQAVVAGPVYAPSAVIQQTTVRRGLFGRRVIRSATIFR